MARKLDWGKNALSRKIASQGIERLEAPIIHANGRPNDGGVSGAISGKFSGLKKRIAAEKKEETRQLAFLKAKLEEVQAAHGSPSPETERLRRQIVALEKHLNPFPTVPKLGKRKRSKRIKKAGR